MKKLLLILLILVSFNSFSQFTNNIGQGSATTQIYSKGGYGADSGFILRSCYADTGIVNAGFLDAIPGQIIRTCAGFMWIRNNTATAWLLVGGGSSGGSSTTLYTGDGSLTGNRQVTMDGSYLYFLRSGLKQLALESTSSIIGSPDETRRLKFTNTTTELIGTANLSTQDRLLGIRNSTNEVGNNTVSNGLTLASGALKLGGSLTQTTDIDGQTLYDLNLLNFKNFYVIADDNNSHTWNQYMFTGTVGANSNRAALTYNNATSYEMGYVFMSGGSTDTIPEMAIYSSRSAPNFTPGGGLGSTHIRLRPANMLFRLDQLRDKNWQAVWVMDAADTTNWKPLAWNKNDSTIKRMNHWVGNLQRFGVSGEDATATQHRLFSGSNTYNVTIENANFVVKGTLASGQTITAYAEAQMFFNPAKAAFRAGRATGGQWDNANVGTHSIAMGRNTTALGVESVVSGGFASSVTGDNSGVGSGTTNTNAGFTSFIGGGVDNNIAGGSYSAILGGARNRTESDKASIIGGEDNVTRAKFGLAHGGNIIQRSYAGVAFGVYNDTTFTNNLTDTLGSNRMFEIGIGANSTSRANAVTVLFNGNMGVGTVTPLSILESGKSFGLSGDISPSQITGDQNDYNPTGLYTASTLRLSSDASRNITGLGWAWDGKIIIIHNVGSNNIVLVDESASSTAANRFAFSANKTLAADQSITLRYDATTSRWREISSSSGGGSGDVTKVGTPVDNQIGVWTGDGTLEGTTTLTYSGTLLHVDAGATFNDGGAAVNFRVETDTRTHALYLDGTADEIYVGNSTDNGAFPFQVNVQSYFAGHVRFPSSTELQLGSTTENIFGGGAGDLYNFANTVIYGRVGGTYVTKLTSSSLGVNTSTTSANSTLQVGGSFSAAYTSTATGITLDVTHHTVEVTATGQTITLPAAAGITGRHYTIKLTAAGSCTVDGNASETIDGAATYSLSAQYKYLTIVSNGTNWIVVANN